MTATNHALTGAVIALIVKQPALAIPLAFLSHFVVDMIPHFDARTGSAKEAKIEIFADVLIGGSLALLLPFLLHTGVSAWIIFACMFSAMLPDGMWGWRYFRTRDLDKTFAEPMSWISRMHKKIQWNDTRPGFFIELGWLALMVGLIFQLAD